MQVARKKSRRAAIPLAALQGRGMMPPFGGTRGLIQERSVMAKKSSCPITRADFVAKAKPVTVMINGATLLAEKKEFSTGSLGWYLNGKTTIDVDGTPVTVQIGLNLTIVGSKELPGGPAAPGKASGPSSGGAAS